MAEIARRGDLYVDIDIRGQIIRIERDFNMGLTDELDRAEAYWLLTAALPAALHALGPVPNGRDEDSDETGPLR